MSNNIDYAKAGYYLEYLQHLRPEFDDLARAWGLDIQWLINRLCTFTYEYKFSQPNSDFLPSQKWIQLLSVYNNLVTRGLPTYPTVQIEKFLLTELSKLIPTEESRDEHIIAYRDQTLGAKRDNWIKTLVHAHSPIDSNCEELHINFDSEEERAFIEYLSNRNGASLFQVVECQRPLNSMLKIDDVEEFFEQRVDFSIETNTTKLVIEVDGQQHSDPEQSLLDKKRDSYLSKDGWKVFRIPAWQVRKNETSNIIESIEKSFLYDPTVELAKENFQHPLSIDEAGQAALLLVLAPIAIARIQWILTWACMRGKINLEKPTIKLAVVEEDIPCAFLAIEDFINTLNNLNSLAGSKLSLPTIALDIISKEKSTISSQTLESIQNTQNLKVNYSNITQADEILQQDFDLIIIVSNLHIGAKTPKYKLGCNNWTVINSVFSPRGTTRFLSDDPINYHCEGKTDVLEFFLQWIFRKKQFFPGQIKILERSLANKDVIGLLPTGAGKSLCYQLSALLQPGMTLIVDPLISLMRDQIDNLKNFQIDAVENLSSDQTGKMKEDIQARMANHQFLMMFISPERLQIESFRKNLENISLHTCIPYVVIDETHCISEWGHDFRPSYLRLARNARMSCLPSGFTPSIIALTGTASWDVLTDIQREIDLYDEKGVISPETFDRKELEYEVVKCPSDEKFRKLESHILGLPKKFKMSDAFFFTQQNAGIIFCPHVNNTYGIIEVGKIINKNMANIIRGIGFYSSTTPKGFDPDEWIVRIKKYQQDFKDNKLQIMVATKAFGMGIDKPNVRFTIHYNIPFSLEAFYQEAGRAGRDKSRSICIILFSGESLLWKQSDFIKSSIEEVKDQSYDNQDDVSRLIYFHKIAWQGVDKEADDLINLVDHEISPLVEGLRDSERRKFLLQFKNNTNSEVNTQEKALYRLSIIGLVSDYTLDYHNKQFSVEVTKRSDEFLKSSLLEYFGRYKHPEYLKIAVKEIESSKGNTILEKCLRVFIKFVYSEIENKRRQAIVNMAEVADTYSDSESFRDELLNYLEKSQFTPLLIEIAKKIAPMDWVNIALEVVDIDSANKLLGGCRRALESNPEHPGLLFLSAFSKLMIPTRQNELPFYEFQRAIKNSILSPELYRALNEFMEIIDHRRPSFIEDFCYIVLKEFPQRDMARSTLKYSTIESKAGKLALKILLQSVLEKTRIVNANISGGVVN
jgi:ATP-dependent DNA helicase RecQ